MSKNSSSDNGDGTSSFISGPTNHNSNSSQGSSIQSDKYTINNEDKGKPDTPKVHEYSGRSHDKGVSYEGGRGENYNTNDSGK
ncbi:MAG: hypothetical protein KBC42_00710 [Candidatus Pacebacteria bacterium]|nr:hypothetical protein [Candidatus Paceibacterota bacterium]MBP9780429.1 hypothetical protein [Candidatus Paceibacterota bacterium]